MSHPFHISYSYTLPAVYTLHIILLFLDYMTHKNKKKSQNKLIM